jgi:hypothetical protein
MSEPTTLTIDKGSPSYPSNAGDLKVGDKCQIGGWEVTASDDTGITFAANDGPLEVTPAAPESETPAETGAETSEEPGENPQASYVSGKRKSMMAGMA